MNTMRQVNKFFQEKWMPAFWSHYYDTCKRDGLEIDEDFYEVAFSKLMDKYRSLCDEVNR